MSIKFIKVSSEIKKLKFNAVHLTHALKEKISFEKKVAMLNNEIVKNFQQIDLLQQCSFLLKEIFFQ